MLPIPFTRAQSNQRNQSHQLNPPSRSGQLIGHCLFTALLPFLTLMPAAQAQPIPAVIPAAKAPVKAPVKAMVDKATVAASAAGSPLLNPIASTCQPVTMALSATEIADARLAWQYFLNNYQTKTGWVNSSNQYPSTTLWDSASYLLGMHAMRSLDLITAADFDYRLNQYLTTLSQIKLFEDALPNKVYNTATGELVDYNNRPAPKGVGWSALDLGRFMTALYTLRSCYPQYTNWIDGILAKWHLKRIMINDQMFGASVLPNGRTLYAQEGRVGYEEYAALGFKLWGLVADKSLDRRLYRGFKEINDVKIPVDKRSFHTTNANNYVVSESYILHGIEFGFDPEMADLTQRILTVQQRRYDRTGVLTAVSEDNIQGAPYFLYNTIYANGVSWATITEGNKSYPHLRTLSTKTAFGWFYLYSDNPYTQKLLEVARSLRDPKDGGFLAGRYEANQKPNPALALNTNGIILQSLHYKARGYRPMIALPPSTANSP
jgi:Protein of unknown function (DUF3131)